MTPRALLRNELVLRANGLAAPFNACSSVRILSGRSDVVVKGGRPAGDWLVAEPGRVALVWERDLPRLGLDARSVEEIGRGYLGGRSLVALRVAAAVPAGPDPVP